VRSERQRKREEARGREGERGVLMEKGRQKGTG